MPHIQIYMYMYTYRHKQKHCLHIYQCKHWYSYASYVFLARSVAASLSSATAFSCFRRFAEPGALFRLCKKFGNTKTNHSRQPKNGLVQVASFSNSMRSAWLSELPVVFNGLRQTSKPPNFCELSCVVVLGGMFALQVCSSFKCWKFSSSIVQRTHRQCVSFQQKRCFKFRARMVLVLCNLQKVCLRPTAMELMRIKPLEIARVHIVKGLPWLSFRQLVPASPPRLLFQNKCKTCKSQAWNSCFYQDTQKWPKCQ